MTTTRKLKSMPYAQACIVQTPDGVFLRSYKTIVCGIVNNWAFCNGLYSMTTRKHIGAFAKEFGLDFQTFKTLYKDNLYMDVTTGKSRIEIEAEAVTNPHKHPFPNLCYRVYGPRKGKKMGKKFSKRY